MNSTYIVIGVAIALIVVSFIVGRNTNTKKIETITKTEYKTEYIYDTITEFKPVVHTEYIKDSIIVVVKEKDTVYNVSIPIHQSHYTQIGKYDLWISGYKSEVDSIKIYNETINHYVTNNITTVITKKPKFETSLYGGVFYNTHYYDWRLGLKAEYNLLENFSIYGYTQMDIKNKVPEIGIGAKITIYSK